MRYMTNVRESDIFIKKEEIGSPTMTMLEVTTVGNKYIHFNKLRVSLWSKGNWGKRKYTRDKFKNDISGNSGYIRISHTELMRTLVKKLNESK